MSRTRRPARARRPSTPNILLWAAAGLAGMPPLAAALWRGDLALGAAALAALAAAGWIAWRKVVRPLQRAARDEHSKAATMIAQIMDALISCAEDGSIRTFNRAAERLFRYRAADAVGRPISELIPDEGFVQYVSNLARNASDQTTPGLVLPLVGRRADGSPVELEGTFTAYRTGGQVTVNGVLRDVSARRRAEEALRRSEASFRALIERSPDAVVVHRGGQVIYANPSAVELFGRSVEQLGRADVGELFRDASRESLAPLIDGSPSRSPHALRLRGRGDKPVDAEVSFVPVVFQGERAVVVTARDLTERKQIEAQLAMADRMAALGTLSAGVAHEINNPLAYLITNLQYVLERLPELALAGVSPEFLDDATDALGDALDGANRVAHIVRDMRALAREPAADGEAPADVEAVIEAMLAIAGNQLRHRGNLVRDYHGAPAVALSEARLGQIVLNIVINALQSLPEGRESENEVRLITGTDERGWAVIEVIDNGCGIDEENLTHIFDPFFSTKSASESNGLGLFVCHGIVTRAGGEMVAESTPGVATRFRVCLPAAPRSRGPEEPEEPERASAEPRLKVLVVDDEPMIGASIARSLGRDHDVVPLTSAAAAIERIRAGDRFDVMLCDLMMPAINGMDLYEQLAELEPGLHSRTIFISGGAFTERARVFLATEPRPFLAKPLDPAQLRATIRAAAF